LLARLDVYVNVFKTEQIYQAILASAFNKQAPTLRLLDYFLQSEKNLDYFTEKLSPLVNVIVNSSFVKEACAALDVEPNKTVKDRTFGDFPALGTPRLALVSTLLLTVRCGYHSLDTALFDCGFFAKLFGLMFKYRYCSVLHARIVQIIGTIAMREPIVQGILLQNGLLQNLLNEFNKQSPLCSITREICILFAKGVRAYDRIQSAVANQGWKEIAALLDADRDIFNWKVKPLM
jgi:hypothetical protein